MWEWENHDCVVTRVRRESLQRMRHQVAGVGVGALFGAFLGACFASNFNPYNMNDPIVLLQAIAMMQGVSLGMIVGGTMAEIAEILVGQRDP